VDRTVMEGTMQQVVPNLEGIFVSFTHVCHVTEDLEQSVSSMAAVGAKDLEQVEFPGGAFALATELADRGDVEPDTRGLFIELLTSRGNGDGFWSNYLAENGPGLHHIGLKVSDLDRCVKALTSVGCVITRENTAGGNVSYYLNCDAIGFPTLQIFGPAQA